MQETVIDEEEMDFESILVELRDFGKFHMRLYVLIGLSIIVYFESDLSYVFTSGKLNYRCKIQNCDKKTNETDYQYSPIWLSNAVPYVNNIPSKCVAYLSNITDEAQCYNAESFNTSQLIACTDFIYETDEVTIINELNLHCEHNEWKLPFVNTIHSIAIVLFLPIMGFISDKEGRRTVLATGVFASAVIGILKSLAGNYYWLLVLEFIGAAVSAGTLQVGFVMGMEIIGSRKRGLGGPVLMLCPAIGKILLGLISMGLQDFSLILQCVYVPALLILTYLWVIPESLKWLMMMGKKDEALVVIYKAAKTNKVIFSNGAMNELLMHSINWWSSDNMDQQKHRQDEQEVSIWKSKILFFRAAGCCCCWFIAAIIDYVVVLDSTVQLGHSVYVNFLIVALFEIPSNLLNMFIMNKLGRRWSQPGLFLIVAASLLATVMHPNLDSTNGTVLQIIGKICIGMSLTQLYVYTCELFPTYMRASVLCSCAMFGRIAIMLVSNTNILACYAQSFLFFSCVSCISASLLAAFPETCNKRLPNTADEAIHIGKVDTRTI